MTLPFRMFYSAVDGGERAIMFDRFSGVLDTPIGEGTHFRLPWVQTPNVMDSRTRPRSISSVTGTQGTLKGLGVDLERLHAGNIVCCCRSRRSE